jgi:hypothetical protein
VDHSGGGFEEFESNPARFVSGVGQNPDKGMEVSRYTYDVASDDGRRIRT